jgi:hypothetical protein
MNAIITLLFLFFSVVIPNSGSSASACPRGDVISLQHNGAPYVEIDLRLNHVRIVDGDAELREIAHSLDGQTDNLKICGTDDSILDVCNNDQILPLNLIEQPTSHLRIEIKRGWFRHYTWTATDFAIKNNACGEMIEDQ